MTNRALSLAPLLLAGSLGCSALESVSATTVVAGTLVRTPEISVAGQFDVQAETVASAWVGERRSATDTGEPSPVTGADVNITFAGNRIPLSEDSTPGFYMTDTLTEPDSGLLYQGGLSYSIRAATNDGSAAEYGGTVTAPTELSPAAIDLDPAPMEAFPGLEGVLQHAKSTALTVSWPADGQFGRYAYVSVFRADAMDPSNPTQVFDNRPQTAADMIEFILGTPVTSVTIPADTFDADGVYAVLVVIMDKQDSLLPNTFLGSPVLAGSGAAVILAVGAP